MEVQNIPIGGVIPSPMNPRKTFDEEGLKELADNIAHQGLLQPITVRPITKSGVCGPLAMADMDIKYEVVCGERRYRAMKMLGELTITAIVRDMTDEEAFDAMITENLQRKDVDPVEEAYAFGQLAKTGKTAEEIAARFGKSVRFVQDRIKLNSLIPELLLLVKDEKLPITGAMVLCKLDEETQRKYFKTKEGTKVPISKNEITSWVSRLFRRIDMADWEPAFKGGCDTNCNCCPYNTANQACLFYEMGITAKDGECTCEARYKLKEEAWLLHRLSREADNLVRVGEPLALGKTVVVDRSGICYAEEDKKRWQRYIDVIREAGYEVINPDKTFDRPCWYDENDERIPAMLASGEVYRCIAPCQYGAAVNPKVVFYYRDAKKPADAAAPAVPSEVGKLLAKYERAGTIVGEKLGEQLKTLMDEVELPKGVPSAREMAAIMYAVLCNCPHAARYRLEDRGANTTLRSPEYMLDKFTNDTRAFDEILREFARGAVRQYMATPGQWQYAASLILAEEWLGDKVTELRSQLEAKRDKQREKIATQLRDLGYDTEGKPLKK